MESERSLSKARQNKRSHIPSDVTYKYTEKAIWDLCTTLPSGNKINESLSGTSSIIMNIDENGEKISTD